MQPAHMPVSRGGFETRPSIEMRRAFALTLDHIQPSQLYISADKLARVTARLDSPRPESIDPIPVARLGDDIIYTDGHTRAYAAFLRGHSEVNVYWDPDELDREMYEICVAWCKEEGIRAIRDLQGRVVSVDEYQTLWIQRCATMHREVRARRARG